MGSAPDLADGPAAPQPQSRWLWALACAPFLLLLAHQLREAWFVCDDAFILFRYARNLLADQGLVFNRGERVEGFVDLLWLLELAGLWRLGFRPETAAPWLSVAWTAATLGLVAATGRRLAAPERRHVVTWLAIGLVACSAPFAVWSTGGLETRQFTCLLLLGTHLLASPAADWRQHLGASFVFAAATLTRPEGLLLSGCAFAWRFAQDRLGGAVRMRDHVCLAAPFVLLVAGQFLWRHAYYGEWLPNPYYAKHVQPWYDMGFAYLAAAAIELGAWLWLPLAFVAMARRAAVRDLTPALPLLLVAAHALFLLRIGGDHFEYRPLDFWLPLLAGPAAAGAAHVVDGCVAAFARSAATRETAARYLTLAAGLVVLVYSHAIGIASQVVARDRQEPLEGLAARTRLDGASAPPLRFVPGLLPLCEILEPLRATLQQHLVAVPAQVHQSIGRDLVAGFAAYESLPDGVFPPDAVAAANTVGVMPFYVRDLTVIDVHGLTDATVARTPAAPDNRLRRMAHDRHATPDYLRQRGVGVAVGRAAASEREALRDADFALRVADGVWMPLQAVDRQYVQSTFPAERLALRHRVDAAQAAGNRVLLDGKAFAGVRLLATFEPGDPGLAWTCTGEADLRPKGPLLFGGIGPHLLSTRGPDDGDAGAGTARSSEFVAEAGMALVLFLAGERSPGLGVTLCRGDETLRAFGPPARDHLHPIVCALDEAWAGQSLHLEVADRGPGWIAIDHVLLARETGDPRAPESATWSQPAAAAGAFVQIAPLRSDGGRAAPGPTTIAVTNPLPCPIGLAIELVEGPPGASLLHGPWTLGDGGPTVGQLAPGGTAHLHAWLRVGAGHAVAAQPFTVRLRVQPLAPGARLAEPLLLDLPLPWTERN